MTRLSAEDLRVMASKLHEAAKSEREIDQALADIRDPDITTLRTRLDTGLTNTRIMSYMLKNEALRMERALDDRDDPLRYSRESWDFCAGYVRDAARYGASLARSRDDLPLSMKIGVLSLVRAWRSVVEVAEALPSLDTSAAA
ncbi:MAG: hypothetical protein WD942_00205 [Dehalococcoidia bacterium]